MPVFSGSRLVAGVKQQGGSQEAYPSLACFDPCNFAESKLANLSYAPLRTRVVAIAARPAARIADGELEQ